MARCDAETHEVGHRRCVLRRRATRLACHERLRRRHRSDVQDMGRREDVASAQLELHAQLRGRQRVPTDVSGPATRLGRRSHSERRLRSCVPNTERRAKLGLLWTLHGSGARRGCVQVGSSGVGNRARLDLPRAALPNSRLGSDVETRTDTSGASVLDAGRVREDSRRHGHAVRDRALLSQARRAMASCGRAFGARRTFSRLPGVNAAHMVGLRSRRIDAGRPGHGELRTHVDNPPPPGPRVLRKPGGDRRSGVARDNPTPGPRRPVFLRRPRPDLVPRLARRLVRREVVRDDVEDEPKVSRVA